MVVRRSVTRRTEMTKLRILLIGLALPFIGHRILAQDEDRPARRKQDDRLWAQKTGLSAEIVRQLRLLVDIPDDSDSYIDNLDVQTLRFRHQVLLVSAAGNGHCLELNVLALKDGKYERIWSVVETPQGAGFCRQNPRNPEAYATRDGQLLIKIAAGTDWDRGGLSTETWYYTFRWNGQTYNFAGLKKIRNRYGKRSDA